MLRCVIRSSFAYPLLNITKHPFCLQKVAPSDEKAGAEKEYMKLFSTSLEFSVRKPTQIILSNIRSRVVTRIMADNLRGNLNGVFEAHIQCLYALVNRRQPSIEAITMFVDQLYKRAMEFNASSFESPEILSLLRPNMLSKLVKISLVIDSFYNETFRSMMAGFVVNLLDVSINQQKNNAAKRKSLATKQHLLKIDMKRFAVKSTQLPTEKIQETLDKELIQWVEKQIEAIDKEFPFLKEHDYWNGVQLVLGTGYYTDTFLLETTKRINKITNNEILKCSIDLIILKIKVIVNLTKFKQGKNVGESISSITHQIYSDLLKRYFDLLRDDKVLFETINSDDTSIQTNLVTQFLTDKQHEYAKAVYLQTFQNIFDTNRNGVLLIDIKRLKGIFEVILIMFTHTNTKEIHSLLRQVQRAMILYPIEKFDKLQMHVYVCDKFGFRSDVFADKYFNFLLVIKDKLDKFRGSLHPIHQNARDLMLAKKFMIYLRLAVKPPKEKQEQASSLVSSHFDSSIWPSLGEAQLLAPFVTNPSYSHFIYFVKAGLFNLTCGSPERRRIEAMSSKMNLKNINQNYLKILSEIHLPNNRFTLKVDHNSGWINNSHARIVTIFQLAVHHYDYLKRQSMEDATSFMTKFLSRTINNVHFYNSLKQRIFYPHMFSCFIELVERAGNMITPYMVKEIELLKQIYTKEITKALDNCSKWYHVGYQSHLQFLEYNRVNLPTTQNIYGIGGASISSVQSLFFQAVLRYTKEKKKIKVNIQTYFKFKNEGVVEVIVNYMEYPHLADLKVSIGSENMVLIMRLNNKDNDYFINERQLAMQRQSQLYWKGKGMSVILMTKEQDIDFLMSKRKQRTSLKH